MPIDNAPPPSLRYRYNRWAPRIRKSAHWVMLAAHDSLDTPGFPDEWDIGYDFSFGLIGGADAYSERQTKDFGRFLLAYGEWLETTGIIPGRSA